MRLRPNGLRLRGRLMVILALALGLGSGAAAAARSQLASAQAQTAAAAATVSGTFIGKADGAAVAVAVVADRPAAEGQARKISVYVCNGTSLSVWVTGTTSGNEADLRSADGRVGVHVTLAPLKATGKVGLSGGSGFRFTARPTANVAGLFNLTIAATGAVQGRSSTGVPLRGWLSDGKLPVDGTIVIEAVIADRDIELTEHVRRLQPGAYRWIVLPNLAAYGASRKGTSFGGFVPGGGLRPGVGGTVSHVKAGSAGQPGWGNRKCGNLANQVNRLQTIESTATKNGDTALADKAHDAKAAKTQEMEDHCIVIQE